MFNSGVYETVVIKISKTSEEDVRGRLIFRKLYLFFSEKNVAMDVSLGMFQNFHHNFSQELFGRQLLYFFQCISFILLLRI